jgi:hypothetical protein
MIDRKTLRLSAVLLVVGFILYVVVVGLLHPDGPANNHRVVFAEYASSASWTADGRRAGCALFDLGEFVVGAVEADLESFDVAEPALALCFGDAGGEVVADLDEPLALGGIGPEHGAADAPLTEPVSGFRQVIGRASEGPASVAA